MAPAPSSPVRNGATHATGVSHNGKHRGEKVSLLTQKATDVDKRHQIQKFK